MNPTKKNFILIGKLYTPQSEKSHKTQNAIVIEDGKITSISPVSECQPHKSSNFKVINIPESSIILPGFIDAHMHPVLAGLQMHGCEIGDCENVEEIQSAIAAFIKKNPKVEWVFCSGYKNTQFPNEKLHRKFLDEISTTLPISVIRFDGHAYFVNSKVLELAKNSKPPTNSQNGFIEKDDSGEPTGVFQESAMDIIRNLFPPNPPEMLKESLLLGLQEMVKSGITSFNDAAVKPYLFPVYKEVYSTNIDTLPRCSLSLLWDSKLEKYLSQPDKKIDLHEYSEIPKNEKIRINTVKIFVDGVIEAETALVEKPYMNFREESKCTKYGV